MRREYVSSREKEITCCLKLIEGKLNTKKLLKITKYIRWTRALSTVSRTSLKLRKHEKQNMKRGCHSIYIYLKINSGFHTQKGSQATTSESNHVQWSFIQPEAHLCLQSCSLDNTLNRLSSAWESFNIR